MALGERINPFASAVLSPDDARRNQQEDELDQVFEAMPNTWQSEEPGRLCLACQLPMHDNGPQAKGERYSCKTPGCIGD